MEEREVVRLLTRFIPAEDEEFQHGNDNKFIEITYYENSPYPAISHDDLSDDSFSSFLDDVGAQLFTGPHVENHQIENPRAITARTKILFAGIIPRHIYSSAILCMTAANIVMLMEKWDMPILFFRSLREYVFRVKLFYPDPENTHLQGLIVATPLGFVHTTGSICIVHNQESNLTYCLCIGFRGTGQERFQEWILKNVDWFRGPRSIVLSRFSLLLEALRTDAWDSFGVVGNIANALSTGDYLPKTTRDSLPVPTDLNKISRDLTRQGDTCSSLKQRTISLQRMLEDTRIIAGSLIETSDTMQAVGLGTVKRFEDEDLLNDMAEGAKSVIELCQGNLETIQIQIQTVYSLSAQQDSQASASLAKLALRDTKLNTLIATLARRDSTDMRVITWITLVFLPGTFTATLFSASFFNFQPENSGSHVSGWIALYLGFTTFLTAVVFVARYVLFRNKTQLKAEVMNQFLQEMKDFVDAENSDDEKIFEKA